MGDVYTTALLATLDFYLPEYKYMASWKRFTVKMMGENWFILIDRKMKQRVYFEKSFIQTHQPYEIAHQFMTELA
jgi:hypothetical protein